MSADPRQLLTDRQVDDPRATQRRSRHHHAGVLGHARADPPRSGAVRVGDLRASSYQAKGYDRDLSFMLVEIAGNALYFRAVNRRGEIVDSGKIVKSSPSR